MATVLKNGINYAWGDVKLVLFGIPIRGITKISYKEKQLKENNYGAGTQPISRGYGNSEYEASIEIFRDEWQAIKNASPNKRPLDIAPFDVQVLYGANAASAATDILQACEFLEDPFNLEQNNTKHLITIPLLIAGIETR